jgi:diamine N-acetyltransferase
MALGPTELREVTTDNFESVIALQVADDQRDFLYTNVEALAWAYVAPESRPFVIYAGDTPVGFATYGYLPTDGRCWVSHLMIDEGHQRRGIGRAALEQLLARMAAESGGASIAVAVNPNNAAAIRLYEAFGFEDRGQRQNGEVIMRRAATSQEGPGPPQSSSGHIGDGG